MADKHPPEPRWLALRFSHLALDIVTRGQSVPKTPVAVSGFIERRERILDCNPAAQAAGVKPGMPLPAALSILENLELAVHDPDAERRALQRMAACCYRYSSQVSVPDDRPGLFLEAGASERLFGSAEQLGRRLERELGQLGYHAASGSAPTPEAAWLAAGEGLHIDRAELRRILGPLPLQRLYLEHAQLTALERMGFRRLRDLLRLPARSLTRRFGPGLPGYLARLLGAQPDPRPMYRPPDHFSSRLVLPAEIHHAQALMFPLKRLLEELCGVLRGGDSAVQSLRITLGHEDHDDTHLEVGLQSPSQDAARLLAVARERLEQQRLPQAVRELRLQAPKLLKFHASQRGLFTETMKAEPESDPFFIERLQARLGREAVVGLTGVADHRPEYSWRPRALNERPDCMALAHRPAWLLPRPERCTIEKYEILAGPERIETGWWDGRDCRRDYFVVRDAHGSLLWAFREYKPHRGWYLHGVFA